MKYNFSFNDNEYKTPKEIYEKALHYFKLSEFDLDVCCSEKNIPAKNHFINGINDGLSENWSLYNWCNPPFNECSKWIKKANQELEKGNNTALILPVRTETKYWHEYILFNSNVHIEWLRKGYKFLNKNNEYMNVFKNALALVYFIRKEEK